MLLYLVCNTVIFNVPNVIDFQVTVFQWMLEQFFMVLGL